jgi:hypothetical protein
MPNAERTATAAAFAIYFALLILFCLRIKDMISIIFIILLSSAPMIAVPAVLLIVVALRIDTRLLTLRQLEPEINNIVIANALQNSQLQTFEVHLQPIAANND